MYFSQELIPPNPTLGPKRPKSGTNPLQRYLDDRQHKKRQKLQEFATSVLSPLGIGSCLPLFWTCVFVSDCYGDGSFKDIVYSAHGLRTAFHVCSTHFRCYSATLLRRDGS